MKRWTPEQVAKLAPDESSERAARGLARPGPWSELGATETLVWGKCQGSGKSPYQVSVDLVGPAFKCSCPSRKFPCKHGLALLLMWATDADLVRDAPDPAAFAAEWAQARAQRAARKASPQQPPDPEAQAKRLEERLAKMDAGIADFEVWLEDMARQGLAAARSQPGHYWERAAARLVDAQLPGLAERVRAAGHMVTSTEDWAEPLVAELSRWYLAARGWQRRDELPEALVGDLRGFLGWARPSAEVREAGDRRPGPWTVLGVSIDETGRLLAQRTWLRSAAGEHAVILDFAAAGGSLGVAQVVGTTIDAPVIAYPGAEPARVLLPDPPPAPVDAADRLRGAVGVAENLDRAAGWVAANPLVGLLPMTVARVAPVVDGERFTLVDQDGAALEVVEGFRPWDLAVQAAAGPVDVFGEWDGARFRPLTVAAAEGLVAL